MLSPAFLSGAVTAGANQLAPRAQRALRSMSTEPRQPRTFSQAKILLSVGIPLAIVMTALAPVYISDYRNKSHELPALIVPVFITAVCYVLVAIGLFRRYGVDQEKVWSKFGKIFYREVRFDEIVKIAIRGQYYAVYSDKTRMNLGFNRFDYVLAYLRILEEMRTRRIQCGAVKPDDPQWEEAAQSWRNRLAIDIYRDHQEYFDARPSELAYLNSLIPPPERYIR